nr:hypothetical protein CFP56_74732 [Quercus suber]
MKELTKGRSNWVGPMLLGKARSREDTIIVLHLRKKGRRNTRKVKFVSSSSKHLYVQLLQKCFEICCYVSLRI